MPFRFQRRRGFHMGSPNALQALADDSGEGQGRRRRRIRRNWVRAEVRCLSCARLIARLLGSRDGGKSGDGSSARPISFFAYRSTGQRQPVAPLTPQIRFRCADCGGTGALDDVDSFSTYDELPVSDEVDEPVQRGPGRPARAMKRAEPAPGAVALALAALADQA